MNELTLKEKFALHCIETTSSRVEAAKKYGAGERTFRHAIQNIRKKGVAVPHGIPPSKTIGVPDGFQIYQQTTHVKVTQENGEVKNIWHRSAPDAQDIEKFTQALEKRVSGKAKKIKQPQYKDTDLSIWLPIGDPHFGMYAWAKETGEDYDMDIAISIHEGAIRKLLDVRNRVDIIYICPLGDLLHADNRKQMTEKSGHILDVDGRYWRVVDMTTESLCRAIEYAATKAKRVKVIIPPGNHDFHSGGHILRTLSAYYKKSPHIEINTTPAKQIYERYGNNLVGLCHGDTEKLKDLPSIMACDKKEDWGKTDYHYWYTGHIHTQKVFEHPSCVVESFNSMTAKDAWTTEMGLRSRRQMTATVLHKQWGEIERRVVRPEHFSGAGNK